MPSITRQVYNGTKVAKVFKALWQSINAMMAKNLRKQFSHFAASIRWQLLLECGFYSSRGNKGEHSKAYFLAPKQSCIHSFNEVCFAVKIYSPLGEKYQEKLVFLDISKNCVLSISSSTGMKSLKSVFLDGQLCVNKCL